jgi:hypothetical protein
MRSVTLHTVLVALVLGVGLVASTSETHAFKRCVFIDCETHVSETKSTTTPPNTDLSSLAPNNPSQNNGEGNGIPNGPIVTTDNEPGLNLSNSNTENNTGSVPLPGTFILFAAGFTAFAAWQHKKIHGARSAGE